MNTKFASNNGAEITHADAPATLAEPQLELAFAAGCRPEARRPGHPSRANWWFQRMRQIVDRARDWQPAPPEQIWFPNAYREISLPPNLNTDQHLICE